MTNNTTLQIHYYCLYVCLIGLLAAVHYGFHGEPIGVFTDTVTLFISTINILVLLCIPLMLRLFAYKTNRLDSVQTYAKWALIQMYLVALPAVTSVVTYAMLRETTPLYCYLIAFVALVFCKPTAKKWQYYQELANQSKENTHE